MKSQTWNELKQTDESPAHQNTFDFATIESIDQGRSDTKTQNDKNQIEWKRNETKENIVRHSEI